jgi:PPOX class probable F420-dependent enzyme
MSGHIPWGWVDRNLRAMRSIWLSTTRPDGRPHATPVWFTWNGATLYFATHQSSQKARNLAHEPWVIVHAGDGDDVIVLEGKVDIVTEEAELDRVDADRGEKYVDPGSGARDTIRTEGTVVYRLAQWHAMAWMYGTLGDRTDWRFDGTNLFTQ